MIKIQRTDSNDRDFIELVKHLDADLAVRDGDEHAFYDQFNKIDHIKHAIVAYEGDTPLGCGAMKEYAPDTVEIKRMYTLPQSRGRGIASKVLTELENWAIELSYEKCVLETGKKQPEAIGLYEKSGYQIIPNYGQYAGVENSVCFEKVLKKWFTLLLIFLPTILTYSQDSWPHGRLATTPDSYYLQYEDGTPFFWLGDTAWEIFHRLNKEEIKTYLDNRKEKGFNVIQAVVLAEMDGLRIPNQYGDLPLLDMDPKKPNEQYFHLVDYMIQLAYERGMFVGLLPTWGDKVTAMWGTGPEIFNTDNAYTYGKWLAERYRAKENVIWILGGDRPAIHDSVDTRPIWRAMAKGILEATDGKALFSYHISGGEHSTSQQIHDEQWLHINMIQSGHGSGHDVPVWDWIMRDRNLKPIKPTLDSEPNYEDHPVNPWPTWNPKNGYFNDYDIRKQTYRSVFSGACGVTYGHHSIWQFWSAREEKINHADRYWTDALDRPGAFQVGYLRQLIESRPFLDRIPEQAVVVGGQGEKEEHIRAFRDSRGSYMMVYIPIGKTITVSTSTILSDSIQAWWFNPSTAETIVIGTFDNRGEFEVTTPTQGFGNDWVLVIDNSDYQYPILSFQKTTT